MPLLDSLLVDEEILVEDVTLSDNLGCDYHERIELKIPSRWARRGKPWGYLLVSLTSVSRNFMEQILLCETMPGQLCLALGSSVQREKQKTGKVAQRGIRMVKLAYKQTQRTCDYLA